MATANQIDIRLALLGLSSVTTGLGQLQNSLRALQSLAAATGVALVARELVNLTKAAIDTADQMGKLAQKTGIAVEEMSALSYAAKIGDLSQQELQTGLKFLSQEMDKAGRGGESLQAELLRISEQFDRMPDGATKTALAVEHFGRSGQAFIPFLNEGTAAIKKNMEEARVFGQVIGPDFAARADQFNDNLVRLKSLLTGVFLTLANDLLPALNELAESFLATATSADGVKESASGLLGILQFMSETVLSVNIGLQLLIGTNSYFLGQLSANGDILKSLQATIAETGRKWDEYEKKILRIAQVGKEARDILAKPAAGSFTESLTSLETLRAELDRNKSLLSQIDASGQGYLATEIQKAAQLAERLGLIDRAIAAIKAQGPVNAYTKDEQGNPVLDKASAERGKAIDTLQLDRSQTANALDKAHVEDFATQFRLVFQQLQTEWGSWAKQMSASFHDVFHTAISSISTGISAIILRAKSAHEAFQQIATTIGTKVVESIVEMGVKYVLTQGLMRGAMLLTAAIADAIHAREVANSIRAFVASSAAGAGKSGEQGGYIGLAIYLGLLGAAIGTIYAISSNFKTGGYTGNGGVNDFAGMVHGQEFVMPAPAVRSIGIGNLQHAASTGSLPSSGGGTSQPVIIGLHDSRRSAQLWAESQEGEATILEIVGRNVHRFQRRG